MENVAVEDMKMKKVMSYLFVGLFGIFFSLLALANIMVG